MSKTIEAHIRDVPRDAWLALRAEAVRRDIKTGEAVGLAIKAWLNKEGDE